jgi:hypothetical protein
MNLSIFVALAVGCGGQTLFSQSRGTFTPTGTMNASRAGHTATLLADGKVLIAGGYSFGFPPQVVASAELYDPVSGTFMNTGNLVTPRARHTATLLPDGRVLLAGGFSAIPNVPTAKAELYDPSSGVFTTVADVNRETEQAVHTATLLSDGRVLVAGIGPNARLFDPVTSTFTEAGSYADPKPWVAWTSALLPDGRVLLTGCTAFCAGGMTQVYDPVANKFSVTGPMSSWGNVNTATLLMNGNVLSVGSNEYAFPADAEVYDRLTGTFRSIGNTAAPHEFATAALLPDGTVLIAGGQLPGGSGLASVDVYDPVTGTFSAAGEMGHPRHSHTATLLPDGSVLLVGGHSSWPAVSSSAELYRPPVLQSAPTLLSVSGGHGAVLHAGTSRLVSGDDPAVAGEILEVYCTGLPDGSVIPPQVVIGGRIAPLLFFGKAPGFATLNQINARMPVGVIAGAAVPLRLTHLGRPSNEVTIGVR